MKLKWNERLACRVMSHIRWYTQKKFFRCLWNDTLVEIASFLLGGADPNVYFVGVARQYNQNNNFTER